MTHVILIDAKNALYRFGFAHRFLSAPDGTKTGAIYGLLNCLLRLKKKYSSSKFVMVWDGPGKNWRHDLFSGYKGNRPQKKSPEAEAVLEQIPMVKQLTTMLGLPQIQVDNMEADDIIGMLAIRCIKWGWQPIVYSSDKDFLQLMPRGVLVIRDVDKSDKLAIETERSVFAKFGCYSAAVLKVRALCGDPSDGIPNIRRGVGPKMAVKLLASGFDPSVDHEHITELPAGINGTEARSAHRNYKLIQIQTAVHIDLSCDIGSVITSLHESNNRVRAYSLRGLASLLGELGMVDALQSRHELWKLQKS